MLDYSIDSLLTLEQWLYSKVAFRDKTKSEIEWEDENLSIKYETEFSTKILDDRSISLCVDAGMYFAEVVR